MKDFKFEIGDQVQDQVTKIKGVVMGQFRYMTGCDVYGVLPMPVKDNKSDWISLDENRLKLIPGAKRIVLESDVKSPDRKPARGGPVQFDARKH
jgi:hypothetical protein